MSFSPVLPMSGYTGWSFLKRTYDTQVQSFNAAPMMQRDVDYFRDRIGTVTTAEELVSDRRLLRVALGAFGLDADIGNRYFIQRVLTDGTTDSDALSSKLADKQYARFSAAFGFGDGGVPATRTEGFADRIVAAYQTRQFEVAVGQQDDNMRLALNAQRELAALAGTNSSDDTKWFTIMGSEPLRRVFETAFGLPSGFVSLDLDRQLSVLRDKMQALTGDSEPGQFTDADRLDSLLRRFLVRAEASSGYSLTTPGAGALQLLQAGAARATPASLLAVLYA